MNNRYFFLIIVLIILLSLQITLIELISVGNFKPDILLIGLIYFTLRFGQIPGIVVAFFTGLLFDIFSNGVIGASSLSKVVAAFITGYFSDVESDRPEFSIRFFGIVFFIAIIERLVYILVAVNVDFKSLFIVIVENGLIPSAITLIFSLFVLLLPRKSEVR
ncbi:MAG: rod shape-determining protein MreD [Ignavibacteria bacterium]